MTPSRCMVQAPCGPSSWSWKLGLVRHQQGYAQDRRSTVVYLGILGNLHPCLHYLRNVSWPHECYEENPSDTSWTRP